SARLRPQQATANAGRPDISLVNQRPNGPTEAVEVPSAPYDAADGSPGGRCRSRTIERGLKWSRLNAGAHSTDISGREKSPGNKPPSCPVSSAVPCCNRRERQ